jgi:hypothetical protein
VGTTQAACMTVNREKGAFIELKEEFDFVV